MENYRKYLELLIKDLNFICEKEKLKLTSSKTDNLFRLKVLILHLHSDLLLNEIISLKFKDSFKIKKCQKQWIIESNDFMEKLRIIYATGKFDENFFNTLRILNKIRNDFSHKLIPNENSQKDRIKEMKLLPIYSKIFKRKFDIIEKLVLSCLGYINILAEYLYKNVKQEKLKDWIQIISLKDKLSFKVSKRF